jgi:guanylate kinase
MSSDTSKPAGSEPETEKAGGDARGGEDATRGSAIVVSAPSGAGKSSLVGSAVTRIDGVRFSVSHTTRKPRGAEADGVDYHFVTVDEFVAMRDRGEFLEWAQVHGNLYGTHRSSAERLLAQGYDVIFDIDVQGARQMRSRISDAVTVFVLPPSKGELKSRLLGRSLNDNDELELRLKEAEAEVRLYNEFDYLIINDDLAKAAGALEAIIISERQRRRRQKRRAKEVIETFGG